MLQILSGVQAHLENPATEIQQLGMLAAEQLSNKLKLSDKQLSFQVSLCNLSFYLIARTASRGRDTENRRVLASLKQSLRTIQCFLI